jgi:hypothetical protein
MNKETINKDFEATAPEEVNEQMDQESVETNDSDFEANTEDVNEQMLQESVEAIDSDFEPRQVGEENARQSQMTQSIYESLILAANNMKPILESCLKKPVALVEYLSFLKSEKPESWIYSKFIEFHEIKFNNLKPEKIIELRLLDIEGVETVLAAFEKFKSALKKVEENNFYYPLSLLWDNEENVFLQNADFWEFCDNYNSRFTHTGQQNQILDIFEKICEQLNELANLNILRPANGPVELQFLPDFFEISKTKVPTQFVVDAYLFSQHRLSRYRTKGETLLRKKFTPTELFH